MNDLKFVPINANGRVKKSRLIYRSVAVETICEGDFDSALLEESLVYSKFETT